MANELKSITKNSTKSALDPARIFFKEKTGAAPAVAETPERAMPTPDDDAVAAARRRKTATMQNRGGRQSTILTDRLGG